MSKSYVADFGKGLNYGIDRAMEITLQNPVFHVEKSKEVYHPKAFSIGETIGKISAGAVCCLLIDAPTLGILPFYNRHKNKCKKLAH